MALLSLAMSSIFSLVYLERGRGAHLERILSKKGICEKSALEAVVPLFGKQCGLISISMSDLNHFS